MKKVQRLGVDGVEENKQQLDDISLASVWQSFGIFIIAGYVLLLLFFGEGRFSYLQTMWEAENVLLDIGFGVLIGVLFTGTIALLYYFTSLSMPDNQYTKLIKKMLYKKYGVFTIAFGAGISEEILFRGALLGIGMKYMETFWALLVVSLIFMALHIPQYKGNIWVHVIVFGMGMVLGWLFIETGALWAPIAAHTAYNGCISLLMKRQGRE
ncbi:CPBP family intramembrane glutamic endopeptidase [Alteribacillus persepolensis]|nr:CPBP family intramembrane glutamic endopeptidase [Alteribacillus persepolensis]